MNYDGWPRILRVAIWMLAIAGALWLVRQLLVVLAFFWDIILLFFLAWLLAFTLRPLIDQLCKDPIPGPLIRWLRNNGKPAWADLLADWRFSRPVATILVYSGLVFVLITALVFIVPIAVTQFGQLAGRLPTYGTKALDFFQQLQSRNPAWLERLNSQAAAFGVDLEEAYRSLNIVDSIQLFGGRLAQNTLGIAAGFASFLGDLLLVIILSFYMSLDMPRLSRSFIQMVPEQWQDECKILFDNVDRTFGGFVRSHLLMAVLSALGTMIIMQLAGLSFVIVMSLFAGTIMLIPVIGAPIALFLPTLIALFQGGLNTAIGVFIALFVLQQLVLHIMMPRIMSQTMGMHPLLVFAALLVGVQVAGFWGALFGIPVVGVVAAMLRYVYQRDILGEAPAPSDDTSVSEPETAIPTPRRKLEKQRTQSP